MKSLCGILFLLNLMACQSAPPKPTVSPGPSELRNTFYSLRQSDFVGYKCDIQNDLLSKLTDAQFEEFYTASFHRKPSLKEISALKKLHWEVLNTNQKQDVTAIPALKDFPTTESKDLAEKITSALTVMNKVLTLTYLETFADRPDIALIYLGDKEFDVITTDQQKVAELAFDMKNYRIFFGEKSNTLDVSVKKVGSFVVPKQIDLNYADQKSTIYPEFQSEGGFPRLKQIDVMTGNDQSMTAHFPFENCLYLKASN